MNFEPIDVNTAGWDKVVPRGDGVESSDVKVPAGGQIEQSQ